MSAEFKKGLFVGLGVVAALVVASFVLGFVRKT